MRDSLHAIIFHQRDLKPVRVGKCWLEPGLERSPRALPTAQRFRIAQTLTHLRLGVPGMPERGLTTEEQGLLSALLYQGRELSLDGVRRKLKLSADTDFNTRESKLVGCLTAKRLGNAKTAIGSPWHSLDLAAQDAAVVILLEAETDEDAIAGLLKLGIQQSAAKQAVKTTLPDGHSAFSATALGKILPRLEEGLRYDEAVQAAGYTHHSDRRRGGLPLARLPYYGELLSLRIGTGSGKPNDPLEEYYGRAPNPTVHVALNQVRRVVNAIIDRHGPPSEIVVETLRELGRSAVQRTEYERVQKQNRDANDARRKSLGELGLPDNPGNRMRLRLWQEQAADPKNRVCPYTGTLITARAALSSEVEEDHILPFALTLDDSAANRILVTREANRAKTKRTPAGAFAHTPAWPEILERIKFLPEQKRWRFAPDAMDKFVGKGDFLSRHLTDSATIARWASEYLDAVAPGKVWSVPGRLTGLLRHELGLTSKSVLGKGASGKDRNDHRHHAIDAVVVALTDRSLLQRVAVAAKRADERGERLLVGLPQPWDGFIGEVGARTQAIVVSHKPEVGWQGALHNDTAYGRNRGAKPGEPNLTIRKPVADIADWTKSDAADKVREAVKDHRLRDKIVSAVVTQDAIATKAALANLQYPVGTTVRRVLTLKTLRLPIAIQDRRTGKPYKFLDGNSNHRFEVWRLPDGQIHPEPIIISTYEASQEARAQALGLPVPDFRPHPAAKLVLRLHGQDVVAFGVGDARRLLRVVKVEKTNRRIILAPPNEAGKLDVRSRRKDDPFNYITGSLSRLREEKARKVFVTPDGHVIDNGPVL
jgi:CRISPR-associated endonuclease Csn1